MKLRVLVVLFVIAPFLSRASDTAPVAEPFEIRFSPAASVYRVALNNDEHLYDCMIQNIAVINRTTAPVQLERIEFQLLNNKDLVQSRFIPAAELDARARLLFTLHDLGSLNEAEKEFRLRELFREAQLSRSNHLQPNEGILVRHQYLQFSGEVDTIKVIASGKSDNAPPVQTVAEIAVVNFETKTKFSFPLKGTWYVSNGTEPSGTHRWGIGQEFAYDLVRVDTEGSSGRGDETKPESYYAYGQDVLAPADGTVYEVRDGIDDTPMAQFAANPATMMKRLREYQTRLRAQYGPRGSEGNFVIIDHGNGEYSTMVHLKKSSIRMKKGDRVKQGQVVAQVGQSGLSTEPHLHFEVVSDPDVFKQRGLPVFFYGLEDEEGPKFLHHGEFVRRVNQGFGKTN
jgi:peptidase M23-like protein